MNTIRSRACLIIGVLLALLLGGCSGNLTDKDRILSLYRGNESAFASAVESGDYSAVKKLRGVREIHIREDSGEIEFYCGGKGLVPGSSYYGILYSKTDFRRLAESSPEWFAEDGGYRYEQSGGDNRFYYEPLGNGFYYYEQHF